MVRYTNTLNDPRIDTAFLDWIDACKKYFGCTYHYVIMTDGTIEIGRDPETISSAGKRIYHWDHINIGVVGGLDEQGNQVANETPEQEAALEWLMQALADTLQVELTVTDHREYLHRKQEEEQEEQEQQQEEAADCQDALMTAIAAE
mgnify:FL=1